MHLSDILSHVIKYQITWGNVVENLTSFRMRPLTRFQILLYCSILPFYYSYPVNVIQSKGTHLLEIARVVERFQQNTRFQSKIRYIFFG